MKKILLALILLLNFSTVDAIAPLDEDVMTTTVIEEVTPTVVKDDYDKPVSSEDEVIRNQDDIKPEYRIDEYMEPTLYTGEEENELTEDMVKITAVNEEKEYYDKYIWPASLISLGASLTSLGMVIHLYTKSKK